MVTGDSIRCNKNKFDIILNAMIAFPSMKKTPIFFSDDGAAQGNLDVRRDRLVKTLSNIVDQSETLDCPTRETGTSKIIQLHDAEARAIRRAQSDMIRDNEILTPFKQLSQTIKIVDQHQHILQLVSARVQYYAGLLNKKDDSFMQYYGDFKIMNEVAEYLSDTVKKESKCTRDLSDNIAPILQNDPSTQALIGPLPETIPVSPMMLVSGDNLHGNTMALSAAFSLQACLYLARAEGQAGYAQRMMLYPTATLLDQARQSEAMMARNMAYRDLEESEWNSRLAQAFDAAVDSHPACVTHETVNAVLLKPFTDSSPKNI